MLIRLFARYHITNAFFLSGSRSPFNLRFVSDHWENTGAMLEANNPGKGARLAYQLVSCGGK